MSSPRDYKHLSLRYVPEKLSGVLIDWNAVEAAIDQKDQQKLIAISNKIRCQARSMPGLTGVPQGRCDILFAISNILAESSDSILEASKTSHFLLYQYVIYWGSAKWDGDDSDRKIYQEGRDRLDQVFDFYRRNLDALGKQDLGIAVEMADCIVGEFCMQIFEYNYDGPIKATDVMEKAVNFIVANIPSLIIEGKDGKIACSAMNVPTYTTSATLHSLREKTLKADEIISGRRKSPCGKIFPEMRQLARYHQAVDRLEAIARQPNCIDLLRAEADILQADTLAAKLKRPDRTFGATLLQPR